MISLCLLMLAGSEDLSCRDEITPEKNQKRFHQEDQVKLAKYRTEVDVCTTIAMWEESEGVLLFMRIKSKHFLYWHLVALLQSCSWGGAPAMNPSYLELSRQSNLGARRCVGIPQVCMGSAHTVLTDCPWTKRMKYSLVAPLCGDSPVSF